MKNRISLDETKKANFITEPQGNNINISQQAFYALFGFLLSNSSIFGEIFPFGVSLCAATPIHLSLATSIGSLLGYIIFPNDNIKYILAIFFILVFRFILHSKKHSRSSLFTFLSLIISSIIYITTTSNLNLYSIVMSITEAMVASGATFFFLKSKKCLDNKTHYVGLSNNELSCIAISFMIIITSLISIELFSISLGKIVAIYAILFSALNMGSSASIIVGVITGISMLLSGTNTDGYIILSYALAGLLAGLVHNQGSLSVSIVYIITNGAFIILSSAINQQSSISYLLETIIASILFILTPKSIQNKVSIARNDDPEYLSCDNARNLMLLKLSFASNTLKEIATATQKMSDKLSQASNTKIERIYSKCICTICQHCQLKMFCWNTAYNDTINSFNDMTTVLRTNGRISKYDISNFMQTKCRNIDDVINSVNENYMQFIAKKGAERKVAEIRNVVTDQFDGLSTMLNELAKEFYDIKKFDKQTSAKAKKVLMSVGFNIYAITSFVDKYGRLTIEATTNHINNIEDLSTSIMLKLSDVCDRIFKSPNISKLGNTMKITIIEKATYDIDFGVTQLSCNNAKECGDSYDYFVDTKGKAHMILSDGMGTGSKAAIDGAMTTGLLSRLIKAGFEFESALKMVNSALLIKSEDESLATVDVTSIDLYTGQAQIFKVGAAPTFAKKSDKILEIDCTSLPAGILRGATFDTKTINLKDRDIIVMVSDGVTNNEYDWIYEEIKSSNTNIDAKKLARKIALESKFRIASEKDDDVTVMVGIVSKGI